MATPTHAGRRGFGLTEALVALFIMAIGLLSLLTLFPLGALAIGQALRDDRCYETTRQAEGFLRAYWQARIVETANVDTALRDALLDPDGAGADFTPPASGPGFPILVDPIGFHVYTGTQQNDVAGTATGLRLRRRSIDSLGTLQPALRTCTMLDDWTFAPNGAVATDPAPVRQGRFTWAAVMQLPDVSRPNVANMTVLCFDGRPAIAFPDAERAVPNVALSAGLRSVTVPAAAVQPTDPDAPRLVRRGGWFMDGTLSGTTRNAKFYRITSVTENGANLDLEFEPPAPPAPAGAPNATLYFFAGLAEAIERPPLAPLN